MSRLLALLLAFLLAGINAPAIAQSHPSQPSIPRIDNVYVPPVMSAERHPEVKAAPCPVIPGAGNSTCSLNWAGYSVPGAPGSVKEVRGSWIVPTTSCDSVPTLAAYWVGIDGFNSSTVEQTGILTGCFGGVPVYAAWYEFYPAPLTTFSNIAVFPGDNISASVSYDGLSGKFTAAIADLTQGTSNSTTQAVLGASRSSAEWIVERPSICLFVCTPVPLSNFTLVSLGSNYTEVSQTNNATIAGKQGDIGDFANWAITMVSMPNGPALSQPTSLTPDGTSFQTVFFHSGVLMLMLCFPTTVSVGHPTFCTSLVLGLNATVPVKWNSTSPGAFKSLACATADNVEECDVTFVPAMAGTPNITAFFPGDPINLPDIRVFSITVLPVPTTLSVTCLPGMKPAGSFFACKAKLTGYHPTGPITLTQGGTGSVVSPVPSCTVVAGKCHFNLEGDTTGRVFLTFQYSGDVNNLGSSTGSALYVKKAAARLSIACDPLPLIPGDSTDCTATVSGHNPTGRVLLTKVFGSGLARFGGVVCVLSGGECTVTLFGLHRGSVIIAGFYSGDRNNEAAHARVPIAVRG